jgi:hypothetical protein
MQAAGADCLAPENAAVARFDGAVPVELQMRGWISRTVWVQQEWDFTWIALRRRP